MLTESESLGLDCVCLESDDKISTDFWRIFSLSFVGALVTYNGECVSCAVASRFAGRFLLFSPGRTVHPAASWKQIDSRRHSNKELWTDYGILYDQWLARSIEDKVLYSFAVILEGNEGTLRKRQYKSPANNSKSSRGRLCAIYLFWFSKMLVSVGVCLWTWWWWWWYCFGPVLLWWWGPVLRIDSGPKGGRRGGDSSTCKGGGQNNE